MQTIDYSGRVEKITNSLPKEIKYPALRIAQAMTTEYLADKNSVKINDMAEVLLTNLQFVVDTLKNPLAQIYENGYNAGYSSHPSL